MGIIISSFKGCGRSTFIEANSGKVKIYDASQENPQDDEELEGLVNEVMDAVNDNDIVFIDSSEPTREAFNERGIDYDIFYPSKERRGEFIENLVRKRASSKEIMEMDRHFDKLIKEIDDDESENCYKHKLSNTGEFIGNSPIIEQYVDSLKNRKTEDNIKTEGND